MATGATKDIRDRLHDHLNGILKAFTYTQIWAGLGVVLGLVLKLTGTTGQHLVFVFFMSVLVFMFVLQIGISFAYVYMHSLLAFLGGFSSLSLALAFLTLIFKFQHWWGSYILLVLTLPILVLSVLLLIWYFVSGKYQHHAHRRFLYLNIVAPFLFLGFLWAFYILLHNFIVTPDMNHRRYEDRSSPLWQQ
jgi:hypothetical protein